MAEMAGGGVGKLGFWGAGKMAEAILSAVLDAGLWAPGEVEACDRDAGRRSWVEGKYGVRASADAAGVAGRCRTLVLAVKPQDADALLTGAAAALTPGHLLVSIAAGKTLAGLRRAAGPGPRIVRVMPNLALLAREGMSAYCAEAGARPEDKETVGRIFGCAGRVVELGEGMFDAVTALSGSGPAFFAYVLKALADGAAALGLPAGTARLMAVQTMIGTGVYLRESGRDVDEFIRAVCSPNGTTEAGMKVLEASSAAAALAGTVAAAAARSAALA